jgi:hypothetical protein
MNIKRALCTVAVAAISMLSMGDSPASAGLALPRTVSIWTDSGVMKASGSLAAVRASGESNSYIGCETFLNTGAAAAAAGRTLLTVCYASDANFNYRSCANWNNAALAQLVQSANSTSNIFFQVNSDNTCGSVTVDNSSLYLP